MRSRRSTSPARPIAVAAVLAIALFAGCSSYKPVPMTDPSARTTTQSFDGKLRVTLKSGEKFALESATIDADSLRGVRIDKQAGETMSQASGETRSRYAVASASVAKLERSQPDTKKTGGIVLGVIGVYVLLALSGVIGDD